MTHPLTYVGRDVIWVCSASNCGVSSPLCAHLSREIVEHMWRQCDESTYSELVCVIEMLPLFTLLNTNIFYSKPTRSTMINNHFESETGS